MSTRATSSAQIRLVSVEHLVTHGKLPQCEPQVDDDLVAWSPRAGERCDALGGVSYSLLEAEFLLADFRGELLLLREVGHFPRVNNRGSVMTALACTGWRRLTEGTEE